MTESILKQRIQEDMKSAMRAKNQLALDTIRMLLAAIKQREIEERTEGERTSLDDAGIMQVINKMIKQRRESITQFEGAGRSELADKEKQEIQTLEIYLPQQLSESEIEKAIQAAIANTGASSAKEMGKVMGILKTELTGRADMSAVSAKVKNLLEAKN